MSLSANKPILISTLTTAFQNKAASPASAASDISNATKDWASTGVAQTSIHTGFIQAPQTVSAFVVSSPGVVSGTGQGSVDAPSGTGLAGAKSMFQSELETLFSNNNNTEAQAATGFANALFNFFSQAQVLTNLTATAIPGNACPAPAGPTAPTTYSGSEVGGIDSPSTPGFSVTIPVFISTLTTIFSNTANTPQTAAQQIAQAAFDFLSSGKVNLTSTGTAGGGPASVDPITGNGATLPPGSPIISGSGTGTIS